MSHQFTRIISDAKLDNFQYLCISMAKVFKRILLLIPLALLLFSLLQVIILKWAPVCVTPLMVKRSIENRNNPKFHTEHTWVPLEEISASLAKAVIASEDNLFMEHNGFDIESIKKALDERNKGKRRRGASTISQQTAKNVFTFGSRGWLRKGMETYYTILIEAFWSKDRIMEVYLNVAEMGPGIYGAEAAARHYFKKSAKKLTRQESALMAVCLPNPHKMHPDRPSSYVLGRQKAIMDLSRKLSYPAWLK